jgi:deoxycytidine triphosphate deaminase
MAFLTGIEIRRLICEGEILVESLDPRHPFDMDCQVTEDCIDLRLYPFALRYKETIKKIDYLKEDDLSDLFEAVQLSADGGYELKPGEVLFTQTLEAITISGAVVGLVVTRSTFARLGLMVNCVAPKFATGISWAFPLQLVNCNKVPIVIYPYSLVSQLLLARMHGEIIGYKGRYQRSYSLVPPLFTDRERKSLDDATSTAAARTAHILSQEIKNRGRELEKQFDERLKRGEVPAAFSTSAVKARKALVNIVRAVIGVLGGLLFGIVGNLLSDGDLSYWKTVSLVLMTLIGLALMVGSITFPVWTIQNGGMVGGLTEPLPRR